MATASAALSNQDVGALFGALVDPIRREVVLLLGEGPRPAGELARLDDPEGHHWTIAQALPSMRTASATGDS